MWTADRPARAALLLVLLSAAGAGQQAPAAPQQPAPLVTVIHPHGPQYGMPDPDDASLYVWVFLGGVDIERGALTAHGDSLVAVVHRHADAVAQDAPAGDVPPIPESQLAELYLDGQVTVDDNGERIAGAAAWQYDGKTGVATILQGELLAPTAQGQLPLRARFDTLHRLQDGTLQLQGFRYTNCPYGHPHWHIETPWAELKPTPQGRLLSTGSNVVHLGDVPVFWLPGATVNLDRGDGILLRRFSIGSNSRFGGEISMDVGGDASEAMTGLAGLFGHDGPVEANWILSLSDYTKRGFFIEPKLKYETKDSKGELLASIIDDQAGHDHLGQPIEETERDRIDLVHRTHIDAERTLDIEVSRQSDADYLREYYEREFREDKPQETYVSYRDVVENHAFTALASTKLNDFDTQAVYVPQLVARETAEPLAGGFLTAKGFADEAALKPADDLGLPTERNTRIGADAKLDWPFDLPDGDRVNALVGADVTWFDTTVDGGSDVRHAGSAGVSWSRSYHGTDPDAHSDDWNISGLRRLSELRVGYFDRFEVDLAPEELPQIDEVDALVPVRTLTLEWRDRLQTHQGGEVATILDTDWLLPVFPDEDRDNGGDVYGPLTVDARWRPGAHFLLLSDADVRWRTRQDLNDQHWTESYASFSTGLGEGNRLHVSDNAVQGQFDFVTVAASCRFNAKWSTAVFWQQDRREGSHVNEGVVLRQLAHCWLVDLELSTRRADTINGASQQETRVAIRLTPEGPGDEDLAERIGGRYF